MKTTEIVAKSQKSEKINLELPSFKEFIAGSAGGVGQVLSAHPLDTIKVRLQVQAAAPLHDPLGFGNAAFKGPIDCLVRTVQHEGFLGLYKGMMAPLAGVAFINAVLFSTYGWAKNRLSDSHSSNHLSLGKIAIGEIEGVFILTFVAGSFAGFVNSFVASPIELLKIRLQAQRNAHLSNYSGPIDVIKKIVQEQGVVKGLYRGLFVTICKEIPAYAGFYAGFEAMKRYQSKNWSKDGNLGITQLMLAGSTGGMSYWICCYPLDMIKSRIQQNSALPTSILANARNMYRQEGLASFFKGFEVSLIRSIPSAAATFTLYEITLNQFMN